MASVDNSSDREKWTADGEYYEYSKAANPQGAGLIPPVPLADFPARLHEEGPTRVIPFDLSDALKCPGPATSPRSAQLHPHPAGRAGHDRPERHVGAVLRPPGLRPERVRWRGPGVVRGGHLHPAGRRPDGPPRRRRLRRRVLLGPRRAPAPLPGRPCGDPPVPPHALPEGAGGRRAGEGGAGPRCLGEEPRERPARQPRVPPDPDHHARDLVDVRGLAGALGATPAPPRISRAGFDHRLRARLLQPDRRKD